MDQISLQPGRSCASSNACTINDALRNYSEQGGGTLRLPPGEFFIGTIHLRSGTTLEIPRETTLIAEAEVLDVLPVSDEKAHPFPSEARAVIHAENISNAVLRGEGTIRGLEPGCNRLPSNLFYLVYFRECDGMAVRNLTLLDGPSWIQHYLRCRDLKVENLQIDSHCAPHNDGLDLTSCRNVTVTGLTCDVDDDAICLKALPGEPCQDIVVSGNDLRSHCNALKCGTESSGNFERILFENNRVSPSRVSDSCFFGFPKGVSGVSLQMNDHASLRDIEVRNLTVLGTEAPIFLLHQTRGNRQIRPPGSFSNVRIQDVEIRTDGRIGSSCFGYPTNPIRQLALENISWELLEPISDSPLQGSLPKPLPYPDGKMFGQLPAAALFLQAVEQLSMQNCSVHRHRNDPRPDLLLA